METRVLVEKVDAVESEQPVVFIDEDDRLLPEVWRGALTFSSQLEGCSCWILHVNGGERMLWRERGRETVMQAASKPHVYLSTRTGPVFSLSDTHQNEELGEFNCEFEKKPWYESCLPCRQHLQHQTTPASREVLQPAFLSGFWRKSSLRVRGMVKKNVNILKIKWEEKSKLEHEQWKF